MVLAVGVIACSPPPPEESEASALAALAEPAESVIELPDSSAQIAAAVMAAPDDLRDGAAVRGFTDDGELVLIRAGSNDLVCLADNPDDDRFQVACYYAGLEPLSPAAGDS